MVTLLVPKEGLNCTLYCITSIGKNPSGIESIHPLNPRWHRLLYTSLSMSKQKDMFAKSEPEVLCAGNDGIRTLEPVFPLENLPVELLATVVEFLPLESVNLLYDAGTRLLRARLGNEGAVRSVEAVSEISVKKSFLWPISATKGELKKLMSVKRKCPYEKVTRLVWASETYRLNLHFLPNTLTCIVIQLIEVHQLLRPYFMTLDDKAPTPLGTMFPSLHTLVLGKNPRRRVLGVVMYPLKFSPVDDFVDNLPQTLTALHFDEYDVGEVMQRAARLPPYLTSLGLNTALHQSLPYTYLLELHTPACFFQLMRLDLPTLLLHKSHHSAFSAAKLLLHFNIYSLHPDAVSCLPTSITLLGLQSSPAFTNTEPPAWPSTLVHFQCHYLRLSLKHYCLPLLVQSLRILGSYEPSSSIHTQFFDGSEIYHKLSFLDFGHHFLVDHTLLSAPTTLSRIEVMSVHLTGMLHEGDIPTVWGPSQCRQLYSQWLARHLPRMFITFHQQDNQYPLSSAHLVVPNGVQTIIGMEVSKEIPNLQLPPSLTVLPPSYGPLSPEEYAAFPNL